MAKRMIENAIVNSVAAFILLILVTLPVAFAQELTITRASGTTTNQQGYYRTDEGITIEVMTAIPGDLNGIQADQVRLYIDGARNQPFQDCAVSGGGAAHKCTLATTTAPAPGSHQFDIKLYSDPTKFNPSAIPLVSQRQILTSDVLGAEATDATVSPPMTRDGKISIRYTVIDKALSFTPATTCSGIDTIELMLDDANAAPFQTITGDGSCRMQGVRSQTIAGLSNGPHTVIVRAKDKFGQTGTLKAVPFTMDNTVPGVEQGSVSVTNSDTGEAIAFIQSSDIIYADIQMRLTKANLTVDKIKGDFNTLTTSAGYRDKTPTSITNTTIIWQRIPLFGFQTCSIGVTATDSIGNSGTTTATCDTRKDDNGPVPTAIETNLRDSNGTYYLGSQGAVIITFTDDGSGVNATTAAAGLADITGRSPAPATSCDKSGTSYRCAWNITPTRSDGPKTVTAHRTTTDLVGNPMQGEKSLNVVLDTQSPIITSLTWRVIEGPSGGLGVPVQGSNIEFTLNGTGFDPSKVIANLSGLGGGASIPLTCSGASCTTTTPVTVSGPVDARVTITASDAAGNDARAGMTISVAGFATQTANFWTSDPQCSPLIDRSTTALITQKVYCDTNLQSGNPNARPTSITFRGLASCTGDVSKLIAGADAQNLEAGSKHPTFGLTLYATEYNYNQLTVTCPLEIVTLINQSGKLFVSANPEIQNVSMDIQFYNLPLSEMDKNVGKQVDDAVKDAKDNLKWIGTLNKFLDFASKMCNLKVILNNLIGGFHAIKNLFGGSALASIPGTPTREALRKQYQAFCEGEQAASKKSEGMLGFLDSLCTFVNCRSTQEDAQSGGAGGFLAKIGGGSAQCKGIQNALGAIGGANGLNVPDIRNKYTYAGGVGTSIDVKNSLIASAMCLCVPGIISNLNKLREVKCQYALCMSREVKEGGLPPSYCKNLQSYLYCNYIVGDLFSLLPITRLWDQAMNILKNIFANPFEAIPLLVGIKCKHMCDSPEQLAAHNGCILPKTLAKIGDAWGSIKAIKDTKDIFKIGGSGYCEQLDKISAPPS